MKSHAELMKRQLQVLPYLLSCPTYEEAARQSNGSICTGKLVFENGNYRTTGLNEAVALIGLFQKELGNKKAERLAISDKTFGNVPRIGLEPTYLAAPEPKSGVSTNSTIWAKGKDLQLYSFCSVCVNKGIKT
jgi:hypothetical protein